MYVRLLMVIYQQKRFSNIMEGIEAAAKWIGKDVHCVMEVTGALSEACYLSATTGVFG